MRAAGDLLLRFDGAGYTLSNLAVSVPTNSNIGLFGLLPSSDSRVYNGTSNAPLSGGTLAGVGAGDLESLIQSGTLASPSAGSGIAVTVTDSLSGANASDYSITEPTGLTGTIIACGNSRPL